MERVVEPSLTLKGSPGFPLPAEDSDISRGRLAPAPRGFSGGSPRGSDLRLATLQQPAPVWMLGTHSSGPEEEPCGSPAGALSGSPGTMMFSRAPGPGPSMGTPGPGPCGSPPSEFRSHSSGPLRQTGSPHVLFPSDHGPAAGSGLPMIPHAGSGSSRQGTSIGSGANELVAGSGSLRPMGIANPTVLRPTFSGSSVQRDSPPGYHGHLGRDVGPHGQPRSSTVPGHVRDSGSFYGTHSHVDQEFHYRDPQFLQTSHAMRSIPHFGGIPQGLQSMDLRPLAALHPPRDPEAGTGLSGAGPQDLLSPHIGPQTPAVTPSLAGGDGLTWGTPAGAGVMDLDQELPRIEDLL